jgi:hypothetical protein
MQDHRHSRRSNVPDDRAPLPLRPDAKVNAEVRVYIDNPDDVKPLYSEYPPAKPLKWRISLEANAPTIVRVAESPADQAGISDDPVALRLCESGNAEPRRSVTDFSFSPSTLIATPLDEIRDAETVSLDDLTGKDRQAALSRIHHLPKVTNLSFYGCDLSTVDERDPVPAKVKTLMISGGKVSQGTFRWIAKFPSGTGLTFVLCNLRGLNVTTGKFSWLAFDNCTMSRSAVSKIVENSEQVTFKEDTLVEDK